MTDIAGRWKRRLMGLMQRHVYGMLTCREFENFIVDYCDGELPDSQRRGFALHLRMCPECRQYLQQYEETVAASRTAFPTPDEAVPDEVPEALIKAIVDARRKPSG